MRKRIGLKELGTRILRKSAEPILTGIVFAVIASLLTTFIMEGRANKKEVAQQIDSVLDLYIGCHKQWVDARFGVPHFSGQQDEYLLCAYISDLFVIQIAYDSAQSAQAYLITSLKNSNDIKLEINDATLGIDSFTLCPMVIIGS